MPQTRTGWSGGRVVNTMPDFGAMHENEAAFDVAVAAITSGDIACARAILDALRDHICSTGEQKSLQWILPKVLAALAALHTCLSTPTSHVSEEPRESGRCATSEIHLTKIGRSIYSSL
jgi:hypothetical protein